MPSKTSSEVNQGYPPCDIVCPNDGELMEHVLDEAQVVRYCTVCGYRESADLPALAVSAESAE